MVQKTRAVEIEWEDSVLHGGGWIPLSEAVEDHDMMMCRSIGYVIKKTKSEIVICNSVHLNNVAGVTSIPRSAVRKMKYLDEPA
jgi:hypothetical protein